MPRNRILPILAGMAFLGSSIVLASLLYGDVSYRSCADGEIGNGAESRHSGRR